MNARNDVKRPSEQSLDARFALAAAQLRFASRVDFLVARWLERCATNVEATQRLFKTDRRPTRRTRDGREPCRLQLLSERSIMTPATLDIGSSRNSP